ncbi:MAG: hypothetical protein KGM98_08400 [Bacteroidota bacterium]|nr:hypothetical protein [Bacteroidota bacterium]
MFNIILGLHSILRWVILILLLVNIIRHFLALNQPFTGLDKKLGLWLMISAHLTLLIGIYLWFTGTWGYQLIENVGMGEVMKNDVYRFWVVEHLTGMLIAIILITLGKGIAKKKLEDPVKHKRTLWYFLIALIVILISVPWPFRVPGIGRALLPGTH